MTKKKVIIKGEMVQDVGYRLFLLEAAESMGLRGFQARNVEDYVEFFVEGDDDRVMEFTSFARANYPELAKVEKVIVEDYEGNVTSIDGFYRSFSTSQLVKMVNIGVSMLQKQENMLQKQDDMLQKQDVLIGEVVGLKNEVKGLRDEVKGVKDEVKGLKESQNILIGEVRGVKDEVKNLKDEVKGLKEGQEVLISEVRNLR
ncbi:MAG: acylphosphatase, partial [Thermoproteota archaeon]